MKLDMKNEIRHVNLFFFKINLAMVNKEDGHKSLKGLLSRLDVIKIYYTETMS